MPNPNAIVSRIARFEPPVDQPILDILKAEGGLSVVLEDNQVVRLDPEDERSPGFAQILEGLQKLEKPVYIEVNPETSTVSRLLIPHVSRVAAIKLIDEGVLDIQLELSHGRHTLREKSPDFKELEKQLREVLKSGAPVALTEDDSHEIIDVREYKPGPEEQLPSFPKPKLPDRLPWWRWPCWPWRWCWLCWWHWFFCISKTKAQQVFDAMNATSCDPLTVPVPCIPFLYPDDGCWGRAHEMCRLMIAMKLKPKKVWIQGSLNVSTANKPNCTVWWNWHVAPTLCVRGPGFFTTRQMVIDPSLFDTPVTKATWKGVQSDPSATLTDSAASIFYLWNNSTDPTYVQTNQVLATYRLMLQNRSITHGPPPYANCP